MPFISAQNPDAASQATLLDVKTKTDTLPASRLTEYVYNDTLAAGSNFFPPSAVIVTSASLTGITAAGQFYLGQSTLVIASNTNADGPCNEGFFGAIVLHAGNMFYHNGVGTSQTLKIGGILVS